MNSPYEGKFYVSQGFYPNRHDGLDLVGVDSKNIHATQKGVVHFAGWENPANHFQGFGLYVCIKGVDNLFYYFGHLSEIKVSAGQSVKITDIIGVEGSTGYSTGSHCHYEIRKGFYKGATVIDVCSKSGIPNKERVTYDDGYRPSNTAQQPTTNFKVGDLVTINSRAKYYNGVAIPSWVQKDKWYISFISGDRVVLGKNENKNRDIQSPLNINDIKLAEEEKPSTIKTLQTMLNEKGYKCDITGVLDENTKQAMFDALCKIYAI